MSFKMTSNLLVDNQKVESLVFSIITVILIIAGCSHEHELLPHEHELLPHDHEHEHNHEHPFLPAEIVRISSGVIEKLYKSYPYEGQVIIEFSQVPRHTQVSAWMDTGGYEGYEVRWEQNHRTVTIYFHSRHQHKEVGGFIQWESGRKHFDIRIDKRIDKQKGK